VVQDRKVEISIDGDDVRAFEIDPKSGIKTEINPETIDGYEKITTTSGRFNIDSKNGNVIRFEQDSEADRQALITKLKAEGKLDDDTVAKVVRVIKTRDGEKNVWVSGEDDVKIISGSISFDLDEELPEGVDLEEFEGEIELKLLENLSGNATFIGDDNIEVIFADGDFSELDAGIRLQAVESMLESAEQMLSETGETTRAMKKAQKELSEAMKALEKARAELEADQ